MKQIRRKRYIHQAIRVEEEISTGNSVSVLLENLFTMTVL